MSEHYIFSKPDNKFLKTFQNGSATITAAIYPWRDLEVGDTFELPYCQRCGNALIKQAERSTGRKFRFVGEQVQGIVERIL